MNRRIALTAVATVPLMPLPALAAPGDPHSYWFSRAQFLSNRTDYLYANLGDEGFDASEHAPEIERNDQEMLELESKILRTPVNTLDGMIAQLGQLETEMRRGCPVDDISPTFRRMVEILENLT